MSGSRSGRKAGVLLLAAIALVALGSVRFDRRLGQGTGEERADHHHYVRLVEYFRGESPDPPPPPFRHRLLGPLLASALPFRAITSLNVLNLLALVLALFPLDALLGKLGLAQGPRQTGLGLFVVSFPVVYYAAIGYVDPLVVALLTLIVWALVVGRDGLAVGLAIGGLLVKESVLVAWPAIVAARWGAASPRRWGLEATGLAVLAIVPAALLRGGAAWRPSLSILLANTSRPRAWAGAALAAGLPVLLAAVYAVRRAGGRPSPFPPRAERILFAGTAGALALWGLALCAAYADGRFPWLTYPFAIPLAVAAFGDPVRGPRGDPRRGSAPPGPACPAAASRPAGGG